MSDVVNRRKQITQDGSGATIHDWLEEKEDKIDLETFECLDFLKILSQPHFKTGQLDTVDVCGDEIWARTKAVSFLMFSHSAPNQIWGPFCINLPPGSAAKSETLWEM